MNAGADSSSHYAKGLVVDTNLLLLLVVGLHDRSLIGRFKRTQAYTAEDFDLLERFLRPFSRVITTPHVLTEVSNLTGQLGEPKRGEVFKTLNRVIELTEERFTPAKIVAAHDFYRRFGLTDAGVALEAAAGCLVLTDDFRLAQVLLSRGHAVVNFNHLRDL